MNQKVMFLGAKGQQLAASLELPQGQPVAYALFAHCFTCTKDSLVAYRVSKALTQFGIAVLRFDFTGLGGSEGDFANTNFSSNINDLLSAVQFLREHYQAPHLLIGHSLGGAAVLAAISKIAEVKAVVTIAAPADLAHIKDFFMDKLEEIQAKGEADVMLAGRKFRINKQFVDDLDHYHLLDMISTMNKPFLMFHSPQDAVVDMDHAYRIFNAVKSSKSFISLDGADHLLTRKEDADYVAHVLSAWVSRYIGLWGEASQATDKNNDSQVLVRETKEGRLTQEIIAGHHVLTADEPVEFGGNDLGPGPYDYLLASLGACTSMTVRMYADLKKIPLERVTVKLNHDKVYMQDCQDCENDKAKLDHIDRLIELEGNLSQEQRASLLGIANKCPVHKTLTSKIIIDTKLVD